MFKKHANPYCNTLIETTKLQPLFKRGKVCDSWPHNSLPVYNDRLGDAAMEPLDVDGKQWTSSKNVGTYQNILL